MNPVVRFLSRLLCGLLLASPAIISAEEELPAIRVAIVGDSIVQTYDDSSPYRGWGQVLPEFFKPSVEFYNGALSGRSSKSFINQGLLTKTLRHGANYLFIQFGHNDRAKSDPSRYTDPVTTYPEALKQIISEARDIGAKPILVIPPSPRSFQPGRGLVYSNLTPYAEAMRSVGAEESIPVIDLHTPTLELFRSLGEEESQKYAPIPGDINHFNRAGAEMLAGLIVKALPEAEPELAKYLKE